MRNYKENYKYCIYNSEEYRCSKISNNTVTITCNRPKIGFYEVYKYGIKRYKLEVDINDIDDYYELYSWIIYDGFKLQGNLNSLMLTGMTNGCDPLARKVGLSMTSKGDYSLKINSGDIQAIALSRIEQNNIDGFRFNSSDVTFKDGLANFKEFCVYNDNVYDLSGINEGMFYINTNNIKLTDKTFDSKYYVGKEVYEKRVPCNEIQEHYGIKCYAMYEGIKLEMYPVRTGIMLIANPETDEIDKYKSIGFYLSNSNEKYYEKIVKKEEIDKFVYEKIEMGLL